MNPNSRPRNCVMVAALVLLGACSAGTAATEARATSAAHRDDLSQCGTWIAGRPSSVPRPPELRLISPWTACFDGTLGSDLEDRLVAWAASEPPGSRSKALVIRSRGGDAAVGLAVAEALQKTGTHVHVSQICASSCANYVLAGVRDRHVIGKTAVLFHGGYSQKSRAKVIEQFDTFIRSPAGAVVDDPDANRLQILRDFDSRWERQRALYRHARVSDAVVERVDEIEFRGIDAENCGGDKTSSRNFLFFGAMQLNELGIAFESGRPVTTPVEVNRIIKALGADFVACQAPTWLIGK